MWHMCLGVYVTLRMDRIQVTKMQQRHVPLTTTRWQHMHIAFKELSSMPYLAIKRSSNTPALRKTLHLKKFTTKHILMIMCCKCMKNFFRWIRMTIDHVVRLHLLVKNMYLAPEARNEQYLIKGFLKHRFPLWIHGLRLAVLDNFPTSHLLSI